MLDPTLGRFPPSAADCSSLPERARPVPRCSLGRSPRQLLTSCCRLPICLLGLASVRLALAYPESVRRVASVTSPPRLPTIDIIAEGASWDTEDENVAWRRVHAAFAAASPMREAVAATGSGHPVNRDRPDVVLDAIARLVRRVRAH